MNTKLTLRLALAAVAVSVASVAAADQRAAIINVAACPSITWEHSAYALLDQTFELSNGIENDGSTTAVVLCDSEIPPDATAFDYAEFEYMPGGTYASPWITVLAVSRVVEPDGTLVSWMQEVGSCGQGAPTASPFGPWLPTSPPTLPLNVCQTQGNIDLASFASALPGAELSLVYLVILPTTNPFTDPTFYGTGWAQAFRIVEYFEQ